VAGVGTPRLEPVAEPVAAADGGGRVSSKEPLNDSSILVRTGQQIVGAGLLARLRHLVHHRRHYGDIDVQVL